MERVAGRNRLMAYALGLGILFWFGPGLCPAQISVGSGTNRAHLLIQFEPTPASSIWFIISFAEESITAVQALERIRQSQPEFNFEAVDWGTVDEPNLFLSSITWQGRTWGSQEIYDNFGELIGGKYWGIFASPDDGRESGIVPPPALGRLPRGVDWVLSQYGISQRILRNGYWDGFVYQFVSSADWLFRQLPALPPPRIQALLFTTTRTHQIQWGAAPGVGYVIESTDDLALPFTVRATRTASANSEFWDDPDPHPPNRRFYRVGFQP